MPWILAIGTSDALLTWRILWIILNQILLNTNILRLSGPGINIVDKSRDITVPRIQKEFIRNTHIQMVQGLDFLGLPRGNWQIYMNLYPDIIVRSYEGDLTHNFWKGVGRSQFQIFWNTSYPARYGIRNLFEFSEGTVLADRTFPAGWILIPHYLGLES
jgi:hypothetical protein